jgi:P-type Ca2+ transporter type 2C
LQTQTIATKTKYKGLATAEAKRLLLEHGYNRITQKHGYKHLSQLVSQLFSVLNLLLISAAIISFLVSHYTDAYFILAIVVLNTAISFWQEFKAEQTLIKLKELTPSKVRALRDGKEILINSDLLVPGDFVVIEVGDKIPADGILIDASHFEVNESALTGESAPVFKMPEEADHNIVYSGTIASSGRSLIKIVKTGNNTKFGQIAKTLEEIKETKTPLQTQINKLAVSLGGIAVLCSALIYIIGSSLGFDRLEMFLIAISSAVALVPEGLPSILLITMAIGVKRMAQKKAVVRKLLAIEGLGSVNVICTDKTGTLTQGRMLAQSLYLNGRILASRQFKQLTETEAGRMILASMVIVNTASLTFRLNSETPEVLGDTTEGALLLLARQIGIDYDMFRQKAVMLDEFSFDQARKSMSVICRLDERLLALIKGAPEFLLSRSSRININGKVTPLNDKEKQKLVKTYEELALKGYRMLAFGYKDNIVPKSGFNRDDAENNVTFLGFAALMDPLRKEVAQSIKTAKSAGIRSVMITGDNELTSMTIARQLGLIREGDEAILGKDLKNASDQDLMGLIEKIKVFARVDPEDKLRIVRAFQKSGFSVAVTGDGVNDALALKQAEIGVAMGKKGTDVAKEAADIVIMDDNYSTIISAVEEGRVIYDNIIKAVRYLLSTNIGEIFTILFALILGLPAPLLPVQILWINLVSDGLPALALAVDPQDPSAMKRKPRQKEQNILNFHSLLLLLLIGTVVSVICLIIYVTVLRNTNDLVLARTWTFTSLIFLQMIVAFLIRGFRSKFNYNLLLAVLLTLFIQFLIIAIPAFHPWFKITRIW